MNCGACGTNCFVGQFAGTCQSSACQPIPGPVPSADQGSAIIGIAASGFDIFFAKESVNYGAVIDSQDIGAGGGQGYANDVAYPGQLRVDAHNVYWAETGIVPIDAGVLTAHSGQISKSPVGQQSPVVLASEQNFPEAIAIDATNVYWTNTGDPGAADGQVMKCAIAGCGNNPTVLASGQASPAGITVDETNVYWVNGGSGADGTVMKCAIAGCGGSPMPLATGLASPNEIVLRGTTLYWTNSGTSNATQSLVLDGTVTSCPVTGCSGGPSILASGQGNPAGLATDGVDLYWANVGSGSPQVFGQSGQVMKCSINGCNGKPTPLLNVQGPTEIAISSTFVTWGDIEGNYWVLAK